MEWLWLAELVYGLPGMAFNGRIWFWPDPISFPNTLLESVKLDEAWLIFEKGKKKGRKRKNENLTKNEKKKVAKKLSKNCQKMVKSCQKEIDLAHQHRIFFERKGREKGKTGYDECSASVDQMRLRRIW
jgi:hypothetical protein